MSLDTVSADPLGHVLAKSRCVLDVYGQGLAYVEAGSGPPVVLIHGALTNADDMLLGPFDALARKHRVLAFDRPGHGASGRRRLRDASPWRQAALIKEAMSSLGVDQAVIVGHSFGGAVALAYGMAYPENVAGVVALAPIVWPEPRLEAFVFGNRAPPGIGDLLGATLGATVDAALLPMLWNSMFLPQAMPPQFRAQFSFGSAGSVQATVSTGEDAIAVETLLWKSVLSYARCQVPVRILGGDLDLVVNNAVHGAAVCSVLPMARFSFVKGMGHMLHHFAIDEVLAAVAEIEGGDNFNAPRDSAGSRLSRSQIRISGSRSRLEPAAFDSSSARR